MIQINICQTTRIPGLCGKSAGLDEPVPGFSGTPTLNDPLLRVRLIVFKERKVSQFTIGINHGLCDGAGICDILQVWSSFCSSAEIDRLPEALRRPRSFGQRVTTPLKELVERLEENAGYCQNPFSLITFVFSIVPRAMWCVSRQEEVELRVNASRLLELKNEILDRLPTGEWTSHFEVLCAAPLSSLTDLDDGLSSSETKCPWDKETVTALTRKCVHLCERVSRTLKLRARRKIGTKRQEILE
eukprot:scaffold15735_cov152-Amphora_coffeaeformis.AAC.12